MPKTAQNVCTERSCIICGYDAIHGTRYCGGDRGCQAQNTPTNVVEKPHTPSAECWCNPTIEYVEAK